MINPSANGWIDKFFQEQIAAKVIPSTAADLYENVSETGFVFGHIVKINSKPEIDLSNLKVDEVFKISLLSVLFDFYCFSTQAINQEEFIKKTVLFYNQITPKGFSLINKIAPPDTVSELESILDSRIQTNKDSFSKNFSPLVTNALLFIDVLAFVNYLSYPENVTKYIKNIELETINLVLLSLKIKRNKTQNDTFLIKLFEASVRYSKITTSLESDKALQLENLNLSQFTTNFERYYFIDIIAMVLWSDGKLENEEIYFFETVCRTFDFEIDYANQRSSKINQFNAAHKADIAYLNFSNPIKHFYDKSSENIGLLISRNKKRLIKELQQSKELVVLLKQSTQRDLEKSEKKLVKKQLLDIFKTIPAFAIFMLPGGSLLLPICIRFIPQLLPSAFNENFED